MSLWRSVLFTPGMRPERIQKAWDKGAADVVVADLEDAVAPEDKGAARNAVAGVLANATSPCQRAVRINAWPGDLAQADLDAVLPHRPDIIVVPKAEDPDSLHPLIDRLPEGTHLLLILETARGVLNAQALAALPRVAAVAFGAEDLAADAGMRRTPRNSEVAVPRSLVALAAAAAGVAAIDMITADYQDTERFQREADEAVGLGYAGKMCLHPTQVAAAHAAWMPSPDEIAWAQRVVHAAESGGAQEGGVISLDGKMIDIPLIRQARAILQRSGA